MHGWPGSFMEFLPMVELLTQPAPTSAGKLASFDVIISSLPGFAFSSPAEESSYTLDDTARIFNTLMTNVLGYSTYAVHGNSNGMILAFELYDNYNSTVRAAHFPLLPFYSTTDEELETRDITLSPIEKTVHERAMEWTYNGTGYFLMHTYRVSSSVQATRRIALIECKAQHRRHCALRPSRGTACMGWCKMESM